MVSKGILGKHKKITSPIKKRKKNQSWVTLFRASKSKFQLLNRRKKTNTALLLPVPNSKISTSWSSLLFVVSMIKDGKNCDLFTVSGFRFRPLEKELCYFLKLKILDLELPANAIEELDDIYSYNPEELPMNTFEQWEKNEAFFFTHRYSESLNSSKNLRDGDWKALGGDVEVLDKRTKSIVGFRRLVVFCWEPELFGMKINWFIHEYRVNPSTISASNGDKEDLIAKMECYVLCRVQAKAVKADKKIPRMQEYGVPFDWDESDSDSEEEHFGSDSSDDLVTTERERGKRYKPALAFQDEVALEELFPKFFKQ